MLKIYASREEEQRLLPYLAEFNARVVTNYPIKGVTRKIKGKNAYKVICFPLKVHSKALQDAIDGWKETEEMIEREDREDEKKWFGLF